MQITHWTENEKLAFDAAYESAAVNGMEMGAFADSQMRARSGSEKPSRNDEIEDERAA
jgi:hypothetical protein